MCNGYIKCESNGDRNNKLSFEEYLNKIRPYLKYINNLKCSETLAVQLTIAINFISSKKTAYYAFKELWYRNNN